jgi:aromatic ring-opening dioxygenase LigB subunit
MCISVSEKAYGEMTPTLKIEFDVDQALAASIATKATEQNIPVAKCIYGASSGPGCALPLDWGASTPLYFMGAHYDPKPKIVVICPSRSLSLADQVTFGRALATAAEESSQRIALIASADQGHAHNANGPYGLHPAAAQYDAMMQETIRANHLDALLDFPADVVADAKVDSLWQTLILAGALQIPPMQGELLSYEVCDYVGVLCAAYRN